jgi:mono/diheme cytochrome c family protein
MALAHGVVLALHSSARWLVLGLLALLMVRAFAGWRRAREWTRTDERTHAAFVGMLDLQLALGLVLYVFLSPLSQAFFDDPGAAMKVSELRFFGMEHALGMLVAVTIFHVARTRSKKRSEGRLRHRFVLSTALPAFAVMFVSVPWPFLPVKRPLVRLSAAPGAVEGVPERGVACPPVYQSRCATCHGASGRGDGVLAASLSPKPRSFADEAWQSEKSDERIAEVIRSGGLPAGLSPLMPAHADLGDDEVRALVGCVRSFGP